MIVKPTVQSLLEKVDSRYTLVIVAAKRARRLSEGAHKLTEYNSNDPVTIAAHEIDEKKITYVRTKSGIK